MGNYFSFYEFPPDQHNRQTNQARKPKNAVAKSACSDDSCELLHSATDARSHNNGTWRHRGVGECVDSYVPGPITP